MLLEVVLRRFGNSVGLVIPPAVLRLRGLHPGDVLSLDASQDGKITLVSASKASLADLLSRCDRLVDAPQDVSGWDQMAAPVGGIDR